MRAVGIVRVSKVGKRDRDENFHSPDEQRDSIQNLCARQEPPLELVRTFEELDVSGGANLDKRHGLRRAVEMIEAGHAEILVVAYFDRLFRSMKVQTAVLERIEQAGGRVLAVDVGEVGNGHEDDALWLNSTMHGMLAEYQRRQTRTKTAKAQTRAIANGVPPFALPPGLHRVGDHLEVDEAVAPIVREAVRMRADGASFKEVQAFLRRNGVAKSYHGTQTMLKTPLLVGEIRFGKQRGTCPPVVDRDVWERAQRASAPRGRKPPSDRLLARAAVLRCVSCNARMTVGRARGRYPTYKCPDTSDCTRRVTVSAVAAERVVVAVTRAHLEGTVGVRAMRENVAAAQRAVHEAQERYDRAVRQSLGLDGDSVQETLLALRDQRDAARRHLDRIHGPDADDITLLLYEDWDRLSTEDKRRCIRGVVETATVRPDEPGDRPEDRITVKVWPALERLTGRSLQIPADLQ